MPPSIPNQQANTHQPAKALTERTLGLVSLALIGLAAFFFMYVYQETAAESTTPQVAAVHATSAFDAISIEARSAIVIDLNTGNVLYEKNADAQLPLASLTKVPLAFVVSEVLSPEAIVTIPYDTGYTEGGQRLRTGERWKVRDILHFTLIASSNEGAEILASEADAALVAQYPSATPGSAALWRMNDLGKSLDLSHTYFRNVSGLDIDASQSGAYGSARDVAKLFAYIGSVRPDIFAGTAKDGLLLTGENGGEAAALNTNEALGAIPGLIIGKTGFTDLAGGNLAVLFDAGLSQPIVAVVLGSTIEGRFTDMRQLVDAARSDIARE